MRRTLRISIVALAFATFAAPVSAQITARDEAKARFETGLKYYDARDFESARVAFAQAYAVLQTPNVLVNLARSELYAGHALEAIGHFEQYLSDPNSPSDKRADIGRLREEAFKKTGHLVVKANSDAEVKLDARPVVPLPQTLHVTPGAHVVEARMSRPPRTKSANVTVRAGETAMVDVTVDSETSTVPAAESPSPVAFAAVAGIGVEPKSSEPSDAGEASFWGWRSMAGVALASAGAVALGIGVGFKVDQEAEAARATEIDQRLPASAGCQGTPVSQDCSNLRNALDGRNASQARGDTLLVIGGAGLLTGGALLVSALVWPHRKASSSGLRVVPITEPSLALTGFVLTSSF